MATEPEATVVLYGSYVHGHPRRKSVISPLEKMVLIK